MAFSTWRVSLHGLLEYCRVLREIKVQFETDERAHPYDRCIFFLRGGYFAFTYLNVVTGLNHRGEIFGGLNHGRRPQRELTDFITRLRNNMWAEGRSNVRLLIVDEVKSGNGLGRALKVIKTALKSPGEGDPITFDVTFYAIRSGTVDQMTPELRAAVQRWGKQHVLPNSNLNVEIIHFTGTLIGYDEAPMCGIHRPSLPSDEFEAYEMIKLSGGTIKFNCEATDKVVLTATIPEGRLVEFLSACAAAWTTKPGSILSLNLRNEVEAYGCDLCRNGLHRLIQPDAG